MNYYVAGSIQNQKNGLPPHASTSQTSNNSGTGLTSVGYISAGGSDPFYGLDGTSSYSYSSSAAALLLFSQKGADGNTIGATNGPKGLTVTLTLVPATQSAPSAPANK